MKTITLTSASVISALSMGGAAEAAGHAWDGGYGGLSVGYEDVHLGDNNYFIDYYALEGTPHPQSATVGAFGGYNYQLPASPVVVGVEASYDVGGRSDSSPLSGITTQDNARVSSVAALNARLGYALSDRLLPYIQAGIVSAETNYRVTFGGTVIAPAGEQRTLGWTVGTGADYLVTGNLFVRASYSHTQLGNEQYVINQPQQNFDLDTVKIGVGYKF